MRFAVTPVPSCRAGRLVAGDGLGERNSVKTTIEEQQQLALTQGRDRMDMYTAIHKALRAMMCDTLVAVGRLDPQDEPEVVHTAQRVFDLLNITPDEAERRFGFLLNALRYGAPPHGGIALGLDRWVMLFAGCDNIRDVIAFPKTQRASDLMLGAPSDVDSQQLKDLHIKLDLPKQIEKKD